MAKAVDVYDAISNTRRQSRREHEGQNCMVQRAAKK